jgi:hypothetical protein
MAKVQIGYVAINTTSGWVAKGQYFAGAKVYNTPKRAIAANKKPYRPKEEWEAVPVYIEVPDELAEKLKIR